MIFILTGEISTAFALQSRLCTGSQGGLLLRDDVVSGLFTSRASDIAREVTSQRKHRNEIGNCDVLAGRCLNVVQGLRDAIGITTVFTIAIRESQCMQATMTRTLSNRQFVGR